MQCGGGHSPQRYLYGMALPEALVSQASNYRIQLSSLHYGGVVQSSLGTKTDMHSFPLVFHTASMHFRRIANRGAALWA